MADRTHVEMLLNGAEAWNAWRDTHRSVSLDLRGADLRGADLQYAKLCGANLTGADLTSVRFYGADLSGALLESCILKGADLSRANLAEARLWDARLESADLGGADLSGADLSGAFLSQASLRAAKLTGADLFEVDLRRADLSFTILAGMELPGALLAGAILERTDLSEANLETAILSGAFLQRAVATSARLRRADLTGANLGEADLSGADLSQANLSKASLVEADLSGADLSQANLSKASLVETNIEGAKFTSCLVYGVSAWGLKGTPSDQTNLVVTPENEATVTVDDVEVAQFIYLLLDNKRLKAVIDTITSRAVLILGRFTAERKMVLDAIRKALRAKGYTPILFDFELPQDRNVTETVTLLARMARFIVADLTDPASIPQELQAIVPHVAVPVQPLIEGQKRPYSMSKDFVADHRERFMKLYRYDGLEALIENLDDKVIKPSEDRRKEIARNRVIALEDWD